MAHELETQNGVASFASFREPAWHGLGTVFTEEKTTKEMLDLANLSNWNVRLEDLETPTHLTSDKNYQYVLRTNPTFPWIANNAKRPFHWKIILLERLWMHVYWSNCRYIT